MVFTNCIRDDIANTQLAENAVSRKSRKSTMYGPVAQISTKKIDSVLYDSRTMPDSSHFDNLLKVHHLHFEARQQQNGYFEKLALLNGATVSLVITAALSKFSGTFKHKYTLGVALTSLVFAMLTLLYRNHLATKVEFHEARFTQSMGILEPLERKAESVLLKRIHGAETVGVTLSGIGVFLLLIEVWLVLTS